MLLNLVFPFFLGGILCTEPAPHPLILTGIHTLNQEWVHINGLGPWSDQLEISAPESSETYGSRALITLDSQSGTILLSHCGSAFVGIFRAGDLSVDILHPAQNIFCAKEEGLPTEEAFDVPIQVRNNDIIFALLPSKAGWAGIKPVDLQGAMYGVEAGDVESFTDFVKNLPKVLKDFNCTLLVCTVSDKPKGLCEPCRLMYSRSHKDSFLSFDGADAWFPFPSVHRRPPRSFSPLVLLQPGSLDDLPSVPARTTTNFAQNIFPSSSSSSDSSDGSDSSSSSDPDSRRSSDSSGSSSSNSVSSSSSDSAGDYNYRSPRSSEVSSELGEEDAELPGQNQESDPRLNSIPGFFFGQPENTPARPAWIPRLRPAPTQNNFPDLNEPIRVVTPFRPPRAVLPVVQSTSNGAGRGTDSVSPTPGGHQRTDTARPEPLTVETATPPTISAGRGASHRGGRGTARVEHPMVARGRATVRVERPVAARGRGSSGSAVQGPIRPARGRQGRAEEDEEEEEEEEGQPPATTETRVRQWP